MFVEIQKEYLNPDSPSALPFTVCTAGGSQAQGAVSRPEGFPFHHILWVAWGKGIFHVGGETRALEAGEGVFCRRGVPHRYERAAGSEFSTRWLTFLGGEGALVYYRVPDTVFFRVTPEVSASHDRLVSLCVSGSTILSRSGAGYLWLTEWLEQVFHPANYPVAAVRQYLETHFGEALTLEAIGAQVNMDRFALCRYYKARQGVTVMEDLKRIRVAKAKQLLRYSACSIEEIGVICGYENPSYFGKVFRAETGRTPSEYRLLHARSARQE